MKKNWLLALGLVLVLALVGLAGCSQGSPTVGEIRGINLSSQQSGIWVSGEGKVTVVPDIAILQLGIESQETSVARAQTQAAGAMAKVMTVLTDNGVAKKDIQTQRFSIDRVTRWDNDKQQEVVIGYRVTNIVIAKIRDIDKVGTTIDAVAEAGGDLTRINDISFSVDEPSTYYGEARQEAMAEAKVKAEQLAKLAGVTLGKPTYISDSTQVPPVIRGLAYEKAVAVPTPISPGEMDISLTVQITYAIR